MKCRTIALPSAPNALRFRRGQLVVDDEEDTGCWRGMTRTAPPWLAPPGDEPRWAPIVSMPPVGATLAGRPVPEDTPTQIDAIPWGSIAHAPEPTTRPDGKLPRRREVRTVPVRRARGSRHSLARWTARIAPFVVFLAALSWVVRP
ncbi:MAG TPA: hypothetical protein VIF15_18515 [Polyangiaceae bacterium]